MAVDVVRNCVRSGYYLYYVDGAIAVFGIHSAIAAALAVAVGGSVAAVAVAAVNMSDVDRFASFAVVVAYRLGRGSLDAASGLDENRR